MLRLSLSRIIPRKIGVFINWLGLLVGLAGFFVLSFIVHFETSYDSFIPEVDDIYRVQATLNAPGRPPAVAASIMMPFRDAFLDDYSTVTDSNRFVLFNQNIERGADLLEQPVYEVEPNFLDFFGVELLAGNPETALEDVSSAIISTSVAERLYGSTDVLGENVTFEDGRTFRITGLIEDWPSNSHMDPQFIITFDPAQYAAFETRWFTPLIFTYVKIPNEQAVADITADFAAFADRNVSLAGPFASLGVPASELISYDLLPIGDIHLTSAGFGEIKTPTNATTIRTLEIVSWVILLSVLVNYAVFNGATSLRGLKASAMRMTFGESRRRESLNQMIYAALFALVPLIAAGLSAAKLLPIWLPEAEGTLPFLAMVTPDLLPVTLTAFVATGVLGGLMSVFIIARFSMTSALRSSKTPWRGLVRWTPVLVFLQFGIATALATVTMGMDTQNKYAQSFDAGYDREGLYILPFMPADQLQAMMDRLSALPGITQTSWTSHGPGDLNEAFITASPTGVADSNDVFINYSMVGPDYFETLGVSMIAGEEYAVGQESTLIELNPEIEETPQVGVILNESAVRTLGLVSPQQAMGQGLNMSLGNTPVSAEITGIVRDFQLETTERPITPVIYLHFPRGFLQPIFRYRGEAENLPREEINAIWQDIVGGNPPAIESAAERLRVAMLPHAEQARILGEFALFTTFLAAFGLVAVLAISLAARRHELAIRKVMGANSKQNAQLILTAMLKPIIVGFVVAVPVAHYYLNDWQTTFNYKASFGFMVYGVPAIAMLFVAVAITLLQVWRTARERPVVALRYE